MKFFASRASRELLTSISKSATLFWGLVLAREETTRKGPGQWAFEQCLNQEAGGLCSPGLLKASLSPSLSICLLISLSLSYTHTYTNTHKVKNHFYPPGSWFVPTNTYRFEDAGWLVSCRLLLGLPNRRKASLLFRHAFTLKTQGPSLAITWGLKNVLGGMGKSGSVRKHFKAGGSGELTKGISEVRHLNLQGSGQVLRFLFHSR